MYPERELIRLAAYRTALRRNIALRRARCAEVATRAAQPLAWLDRALAFLRRLSPLAKLAVLPMGFLVMRAVFPRLKLLGSLMRWGPLVFSAMRSLTRTRDGASRG